MLVLAQAESPGLTPLSAATSVVVMLLALGMAAVALRARRKRNNPALLWVGVAFLVFALKNAFSAYNVVAHDRLDWSSIPHDEIELILSLFDLVIMVLLFAPLFLRKRG